MALTEANIRAVGAKIVAKSKRESRVDTGALKRSISFSYVKKIMIFRQMYYGKFGTNSTLEKNAKKMVPRGVQWKLIQTDFGGNSFEIGRTRSGRATQKTTLKTITNGSSKNIKALIAKNKAKKAKEAADGKT